MRYPVVIHKDPESDYGVSVPDLPGCFSAGATLEEALSAVVEAIETHIEGLLLDNEPLSSMQSLDEHLANPDYADGIWALVSVDLTRLSGRTRRVNITVPERVLTMMDKFAGENGETRSSLITHAAIEYITGHGIPPA